MHEYVRKVLNAADYIRSKIGDFQPEIGLITGTGLGDIVSDIQVEKIIPYSEIEGFPISTVQSHKGEMVFGHCKGVKILVLSGRLHYYEGFNMREVTFPVRVLGELKVEKLIVSNVSGGINENYEMGDVVFLSDHINLMPENPLRGENFDRWGPRFPDMKDTYNAEWNQRGVAIAEEHNLTAHTGVYIAFPGPNLETPAEYVFLNKLGGDLVGMSTVPEVLVAKHMGMPVLVFSLVSNKCFPPSAIVETSIEDVISVGREKSPLLRKMVCRLIQYLSTKK
nr:purine-nucleoside phosphorylase [Saprospiraceae bacterium]